MLAEDLEQEAREAAFGRLQETPDSPASHLVVKAKDAIYKYRRKGSSVDGKLNPNSRDRRHPTFSLQEPICDENDLKEEIIGDPQQGRRPTELYAVTSTLVDQLRESLSEEEDQAFVFRLTETTWTEISQVLGQGEPEMYRIRTALEEKALTIWKRSEDYTYNGRREKAAPSRASNLPGKMPTALLDALSEEERQAVAAYRGGATQNEAARAAGISQPTVSRIISFVRQNHDKRPEEIVPRTWRYRNSNRREQVLELFFSRPAGELVTYEELLGLFSDVTQPRATAGKTIRRYSRQLEGAEIKVVRGEGYKLVKLRT